MHKNERGSMVLALVVGFALIAGSMALFNYLRGSNITLGYVSDRSRVDPGQAYIFARLQSCLTLSDPAHCPKAGDFKTLLTLPVTKIDETTVAPVAPVNLSKSDMEGVTGFLTARQSELDQTFSDFSAKIERQASVSDPVLGSTRVSITLSLKPIGHTILLQSRDVTRSYRVTVQTPLSFGLVMRNPNAPSIIVNPASGVNSSLSVIGGTLYYTLGAGLQPQTIVDAGSADYVRFDRAWTTAGSIAINDANDKASFKVFDGGVQVQAFPMASNPFANLSYWSQPMDYGYVFKAGGYPLPRALASGYTPAHGGSNCERRVDWDKNTSTPQYRSYVTAFPNDDVMGSGVGLNETCARPDNFAEGSMKALILLRAGENLSFDYVTNPAQYACGMVVADTITFNVPNAQTVVWYGHINARQIIVNGGGHLVILNPFSAASRAGDLPQPPNLAISELQTLFVTLGSSTGHNFFVPFSRTPANFPAIVNYNTIDNYFTIPSGAGYCSTWVDTVDPPDLTGYLSGTTWDQDIFFNAEEGL